jgi:hypothetical protein
MILGLYPSRVGSSDLLDSLRHLRTITLWHTKPVCGSITSDHSEHEQNEQWGEEGRQLGHTVPLQKRSGEKEADGVDARPPT